MDAFRKSLYGWENLEYSLEGLEKISVPAGCFVISASGVLQACSQAEGANPFWHVESIDITTCNFFRQVALISDCVHGSIKKKHGIIEIGNYSMHVYGISIRDHWGNLVCAGKFNLQGDQVDWINPCRTDQEEQSVLESARKILAEASFERQWANHGVAKELEIYANLLKGKIIHPRWKDPILSLLSLKRKFS